MSASEELREVLQRRGARGFLRHEVRTVRSFADKHIPKGSSAEDVAGLAVDAAEGLHWDLAAWLFRQAAFRADTGPELDRFTDLSNACSEYGREVRP